MTLRNVNSSLHVFENLGVAEQNWYLAIFLLFSLLEFFFALLLYLVELRLSLFCHIRVLLFNHVLHHEIHLQVCIARLKDLSLAESALTALLEGALETLLAERVATGRRHWLIHQLPANRALKLLLDVLFLRPHLFHFNHLFFISIN